MWGLIVVHSKQVFHFNEVTLYVGSTFKKRMYCILHYSNIQSKLLKLFVSNSADDIEGSGSGDTVLDFSSVEGRSEGVSGDLVEVWREEHSEWYSELQTWNSLIGRVAESEGAEPLLDPIDLWRDNLSNWADDFATYNMTFYDLCPSRP